MEQWEGFGPPSQKPGEEASVSSFHVVHNLKYVEGWQIFCTDCNKPCHTTMSFYPCLGRFMIDRIKCRLGCGKRWVFKPDCEKPVCH